MENEALSDILQTIVHKLGRSGQSLNFLLGMHLRNSLMLRIFQYKCPTCLGLAITVWHFEPNQVSILLSSLSLEYFYKAFLRTEKYVLGLPFYGHFSRSVKKGSTHHFLLLAWPCFLTNRSPTI